MKLWSIDIKICATAYIKAETEEEAMKIANDLKNNGLELDEQDGETPISCKQYSDPDLPDVSLSPAMTLYGPWEESTPDCVHDYEEEDEDEDTCLGCGAVPGTPEYGTVGDGFDGYCPSCADKREVSGEVEVG